MLDYSEALSIVLEQLRPMPPRVMPLGGALFCRLAEDVAVDLDAPPFDRSIMDGYAVKAKDTVCAPTWLEVIGQVPAGSVFGGEVAPGQAVQISTGASIPLGADAVVRVEDTQLDPGGKRVLVSKPVSVGNFVAHRGAYFRAGARVLEKGTLLGGIELAAAAAAGRGELRVFPRPGVWIITTGDELVEPTTRPKPGQIRNSNKYLLEGLFAQGHAHVHGSQWIGDDQERLREGIQRGLDADLLCITGAVSMGPFDFVPHVLMGFGATLFVHKMSIKPGRPTIFAMMSDGKPVFALPGNPGSVFVAFHLLVRPALGAMQGVARRPKFFKARVLADLPKTGARRTFVPSRAECDSSGQLTAHPLKWGGSGDALGLCGCNALIMQAPNSSPLSAGGFGDVLLLEQD